MSLEVNNTTTNEETEQFKNLNTPNKGTMHIIWDFSYLYYKYYFAKKSGRLGELTTAVERRGSNIIKDVTIIYHTLKEIEGQRAYYEARGYDVTSTVCFDAPSLRKDMENGTGYKEGRTKTLTDDDFEDMLLVYEILENAGHNCYRIEGYEADDLVTNICQKTKDSFDYTLIQTPDKDLAINIDTKVALVRYKSGKGYTPIIKENYSSIFQAEFNCNIPYNSILLFLASVGDKSDKVKGISKFGPKAFDKLINSMNIRKNDIESKLGESFEWEKFSNIEYTDKVVKILADCNNEFLTEKQAEEFLNSYYLVRPIDMTDSFLNEKPLTNKVTLENRVKAYIKYDFKSLI